MRPVFTHSRQASETSQPGSIPSSNATTSSAERVSSTNAPTSVKNNVVAQTLQQKSQVNHTAISKPQKEADTSKKVVRVGSIFSGPKTQELSTVSSANKGLTESPNDSVITNIKIDQLTLLTAWKGMCSNKDVFDNATKMRIESVEPKLIDNNKFEISVANPNVELFFKQNKNTILNELSSQIDGHKMEMEIRIIESNGPQKILTPVEQVSEMITQNSSFGKLKDVLNLALN